SAIFLCSGSLQPPMAASLLRSLFRNAIWRGRPPRIFMEQEVGNGCPTIRAGYGWLTTCMIAIYNLSLTITQQILASGRAKPGYLQAMRVYGRILLLFCWALMNKDRQFLQPGRMLSWRLSTWRSILWMILNH